MELYFSNPDHFAGFLSLCICFLSGVNWQVHSKHKALFHGLNAVIIYLCFLLAETYIRGAWLSVLGVLFYLFVINNNKLQFFTDFRSSAMTVSFGVILIALLIYGLYLLKPDSADGRLLIWKITLLYLIAEHFFAGTGFGTFHYLYNKAQAQYFLDGNGTQREMLLAGNVEHAHNEYLHFAAELGVPLTLLLLVLLFWIFKSPDKRFQSSLSERIWYKAIVAGAKCGMLSVAVTSVFSFPLHIWQTATAFSLCLLLVFFMQHKHRVLWSLFGSGPASVPHLKNHRTAVNISTGILLLSMSTGALWYGYQKLDAFKEQQKNIETARWYAVADRYHDATAIYRDLYDENTQNGKFLFLYGAAEMEAGNFERAKMLLEQSETIYSNPNLYLSLAKTYENLGAFSKAEETYRYVFNMIPHRFYPLHKLTELYLSRGETEKAVSIAQKITDMPVKISSPAVDEIKERAATVLKNHETL
jgi:hypothetical protein